MIAYFRDTDSFMELEAIHSQVYQGKVSPDKVVELMDSRTGELFGVKKVRDVL